MLKGSCESPEQWAERVVKTPILRAFISRHLWLFDMEGGGQKMRDDAFVLAERAMIDAMRNGLTTEEQIENADVALRRAFPERYADA